MLALRWLLIALKLAQTSAANPCAGAYQLALGCGFDLLPDARRRTECNELLIVGHGSPIFVSHSCFLIGLAIDRVLQTNTIRKHIRTTI
jgi:hypothetical protein